MIDDAQRVLWSIDEVRQQQCRSHAAQYTSSHSEAGCYRHHDREANERKSDFQTSLMKEERQNESNRGAKQSSDRGVEHGENFPGMYPEPHRGLDCQKAE